MSNVKIPKKIKNYLVKIDNNLKSFGESNDKTKEVKINLKKNKDPEELKDTIQHEKYHVLHPKATEKETYKAVKKKLNKR